MTGKEVSELQEKRIAKLLGGKVQPNSGGTRFGGGDILSLDRPKSLRGLPRDPEEAMVELIRRVGPCSFEELKMVITRARKHQAENLVTKGELVKLDEDPDIYGLPTHKLRY